MYVDFEATGNFVKTTKAKLHRYYRKHVTDWVCFSDWLFDMRRYDLIRKVV